MQTSQQACERPHFFGRLTVALLPAIVFVTARAILPMVANSSEPVCLFRIVTGKPCLFCGLTHAFAYASHGEFAMACKYHPLWWVFAILIVAASGVAWMDLFRKTSNLERMWTGMPLASTGMLLLVLSVARWIAGV